MRSRNERVYASIPLSALAVLLVLQPVACVTKKAGPPADVTTDVETSGAATSDAATHEAPTSAAAATPTAAASGAAAPAASDVDADATAVADDADAPGGRSKRAADEYLPGGPLAGLRLPLLRGDHGEPPGHPGCIPGQAGEDGEAKKRGPEGQSPQVELYPGSIEQWRAYMQKYMPIRSFFDRQSLVRMWVAPDLPAEAGLRVEEYAPPVYWVRRHGSVGEPTAKRWNPRTVVRARVGDPVFKMEFGELAIGMYCVRVVGAVETKELARFRKPVFFRLDVNDRVDGATSSYRVRCNYVDEFYSIAEIYFHAPARRSYRGTLLLDEGSAVDVLVRRLVIDDALAGVDFRAIKTRTTLGTRRERTGTGSAAGGDRLARDRAIWRAFPRINSQAGGSRDRNQANPHMAFHDKSMLLGAEGKTEDEVAATHGKWVATPVRGKRGAGFGRHPDLGEVILRNEKLGLAYTVDDHLAGRPLPDPFPYGDDGAGVYFPVGPEKGYVYCPIADAVDRIRAEWMRALNEGASRWTEKGDEDAARDAAVGLIRFAYQLPAIDTANQIPAVAATPGLARRDSTCRKRATAAYWLPHYANYHQFAAVYDSLFSYIDGNDGLARSIGRFVPWVKTDRDLVKLLDAYLVQTSAKRQMRYHWHTGATGVATLAAVLGDREAVEPLMDWTFSRAWKYPLKPAGLQDIMIVANDRTGRSYVGSWYYATAAQGDADSVARFKVLGILPDRYDLTDAARFPKPRASLYWAIESAIAGYDFPRIADVCGPDKYPQRHYLPKVRDVAAPGWRSTRDPKFAWILKHHGGRKGFDDGEWARIEEAAATVPRAPWLDNRSRQVYNWFATLETGHAHDDVGFRRAVYVRVGAGTGHHHEDSLDLHVVAHGAPMTIDGGQRPGYSTPADRSTRLHNTVEVHGASRRVQSWARGISDGPGARCMRIGTAPPPGTSLYERQVALIDVDEGDAAATPIVTPNSYVLDVFRVAGGRVHTYSFHGPMNDELVVNATLTPVPSPKEGEDPTPDQDYLKPYQRSRESWMAGDAPDDLVATWRYDRTSEKHMAHAFDADGPRRHTRLHLLGARGMRILRAEAVCQRWKYHYSVLHAQRRAAGVGALDSAFAAIIEPYVGQPFVTKTALVPIDGNEDDARRAVAVEVRTRDGHIDLCVADGRPDSVRTVRLPGRDGVVRASGGFAYVSHDDGGVRQVALTQGTLLDVPGLRITAGAREYTGTIRRVDYLKRTVIIDAEWPASVGGGIMEVMAPGEDGTPVRTTSYTVVRAEAHGDGQTLMELKGGADYFRSSITGVDAAASRLTCALKPTLGRMAGLTKGFTASNDQRTRFWRAEYVGHYRWRLTGAPVNENDFRPSNALRIWEHGVGDRVRASMWTCARRVGESVFEFTGNAEVALALEGGGLEMSADRTRWTPLVTTRDGSRVEARITLAATPVFVRATR